ncbi:MAG: GNAT family N-acetyltransferase [Clostridia bacterium]|nr:GNAT family N-acetyltransferase [Clostridia bacterium]
MNFIAKYFNELSLSELYEILKARSQIFIVEQRMHCQDIDGIDLTARHCFLEDDGKVLAYLRAFYEEDSKRIVRIGRVLSVTHGIGLGAALMEQAIEDIQKNMPCQTICLDSQKHAIGFYEKLGFETVSDEFLEEGVLHVRMERKVAM